MIVLRSFGSAGKMLPWPGRRHCSRSSGSHQHPLAQWPPPQPPPPPPNRRRDHCFGSSRWPVVPCGISGEPPAHQPSSNPARARDVRQYHHCGPRLARSVRTVRSHAACWMGCRKGQILGRPPRWRAGRDLGEGRGRSAAPFSPVRASPRVPCRGRFGSIKRGL